MFGSFTVAHPIPFELASPLLSKHNLSTVHLPSRSVNQIAYNTIKCSQQDPSLQKPNQSVKPTSPQKARKKTTIQTFKPNSLPQMTKKLRFAVLGSVRILAVIPRIVPKQRGLGSYTQYKFIYEDTKSGRKWQIWRRYSEFLGLKESLLMLFDAPHCHFCHKLCGLLNSLPFPGRRIWGSTHEDVISARAKLFQLHIDGLLKIIVSPFYMMCPILSLNVRRFLYDFLTIKSEEYSSIIIANEVGNQEIPSILEELLALSPEKSSLSTIFEDDAFDGICVQ